jgi:phenylalanyl-tRNA synthetase alpha chain
MLENLKEIEQNALSALESVKDQAALEAWRVAHLGRSSPVMGVFSSLGQLGTDRSCQSSHAGKITGR